MSTILMMDLPSDEGAKAAQAIHKRCVALAAKIASEAQKQGKEADDPDGDWDALLDLLEKEAAKVAPTSTKEHTSIIAAIGRAAQLLHTCCSELVNS